MGWFGSKKQPSASTGSNSNNGGIQTEFVDLEGNLPVATVVNDVPPPPAVNPQRYGTSAPTASLAPAIPSSPATTTPALAPPPPTKTLIPAANSTAAVTTASAVYPAASQPYTVYTKPQAGGGVPPGASLGVVSETVQIQNFLLNRQPAFLKPCMHCGQNSRTRVETHPNWVTWVSVLALLFVFWPLCWLPLVWNCSRQSDHYCQSCHQWIGTIHPYQDCCVQHRR